jgi:hypothetical protein
MSNHRQKNTLRLTAAESREYEHLQQKMKVADTPELVRLYAQEIQMFVLAVQARQRQETESFVTLATEGQEESVRLPVEDYNELERLKQLMEFADTPGEVRLYSHEIQSLIREAKARQRKDKELKI